MPIASAIESLSTTAASNGPAGTEQRTLADDGLRQAFAFIKQLASEGSQIASASTITPPSNAYQFDITGTTTINTIASTNSWDGRRILLIFSGALTLTHSSNLDLPGAGNITTAGGDAAEFVQFDTGGWRCINYMRGGVQPPYTGTYTPTLTNTTNIESSSASTNQYVLVGDMVTVSGRVAIDPTATGAIELGMTIPVASDFSSAIHAGGTAISIDGIEMCAIYADATNNRLIFAGTVGTTGVKSYSFHVTYRIL